jgi:hypothetical protein
VLRQYEYNIIKIAARIDSGKSVGKFGKPERLRVAAFRNPTTNRCTFLELGEIAFEIVQALSDHAHSYADLIKLSIARQPGSEPQQCVEEFLTMNDTLQKLNFFQGSALLDEAT